MREKNRGGLAAFEKGASPAGWGELLFRFLGEEGVFQKDERVAFQGLGRGKERKKGSAA